MAHPKKGYHIDLLRIPGVTTIIGRFKDSGALMHWAFNQGKAAERGEINGLYDKRDEAAELGTLVHDVVEEMVRTDQVDDPEIVLGDWDAAKHLTDAQYEQVLSGATAFSNWANTTHIEIVEQEVQLVSREYRFGGTPDAIGVIDGEYCLLDWKTSKGVYPDFLIQLAAYKHLVEEGERLNGADWEPYEIKGFHLCKFSKNHGDFSHHYFKNLDEAWELFKLYRQAYDLDKALKLRV